MNQKKRVSKAAVKRRPVKRARVSRRKSDPAPAPVSERFVNDLLVRGEAAPLDDQGKLPVDATHVITKKKEDGTTEVKRLRYKLY